MGAAFGATYSWDFSKPEEPVMGGTVSGSYTTQSVEIDGATTTVLTAGNNWSERSTSAFADGINAAVLGTAGESITLAGTLSYTNTSGTGYILHVGRDGFGLSLGIVNGHLALSNGALGSNAITLGAIASGAADSRQWVDFSVTIGNGGAVSYTIGSESGVATSAFSTNWYTGTGDGGSEAQRNMYSLAQRAPGWSNNPLSDVGGMLSQFSVDIVPEPTTSTLGLLALAGLCARRRRK